MAPCSSDWTACWFACSRVSSMGERRGEERTVKYSLDVFRTNFQCAVPRLNESLLLPSRLSRRPNMRHAKLTCAPSARPRHRRCSGASIVHRGPEQSRYYDVHGVIKIAPSFVDRCSVPLPRGRERSYPQLLLFFHVPGGK